MRQALLLAAMWVSSPAFAITCSIQSVTSSSFGSYDVLSGSPLDTAATITFLCTSVAGPDNITIDLDQGGASSFNPRELGDGGSNTLEYNLYTNAGRTVIFGDGTSGTANYGPTNPPDNVSVDVDVFGRIPAMQSTPAGSYTDTITVTLTY